MGIKLISGVVLTTVILGAAVAFAQQPHGEMPPLQPPPPAQFECGPPPPPLPFNLSPVVKAQIEDLQDGEQEQTFPLRQKLLKNRRALRKAAEKRPFDETTVRGLANEQAKLQAELLISHLRTQSLIHDLMERSHPVKK